MTKYVAQYPTEADFLALFQNRQPGEATPALTDQGATRRSFAPLKNKPYAACVHPSDG